MLYFGSITQTFFVEEDQANLKESILTENPVSYNITEICPDF